MAEAPPKWRPFHSVPSRVILSVFAATLITSLIVTWVSVRSIHAFLNGKIEQKFPVILRGAVERLDLWYSQRELDVVIFARRELLVENLARVQTDPASRRAGRARSEIHDYLSFVLQRFPQYDGLAMLDREGRTILAVGADFELPPELRAPTASVTGSTVSGAYRIDGRRVQLASASIETSGGVALGSLHAVLRLKSLEGLLRSEDLGPSGRIFVVTRQGEVLAGGGPAGDLKSFRRPLPEPGAQPVVSDYTNGAGEHVVGSAAPFPRFGWSVAVEEHYDEAFEPIFAVIGRALLLNLGVVVLFGLVAYRITRSIVRPIQALSEGARRISEGGEDVVIPLPRRNDELALLTRTFNEMVGKLNANRAELKRSRLEIEAANERLRDQNHELQRANEALAQLSITDGLTKLHNHRFFQEHLTREVKRADRSGQPLSLILIDIDNFKSVNDRLGHAGGDAILRQIAEIMNGGTRETDLLARYGGEEFAVVASQTDVDGATALAEKIRLSVADAGIQVAESRDPTRITVSIGVALYDGDRKDFFNRADRALYQAKSSGKDCVVVAGDAQG